jgi:hypothetical protein
MTSLNHRPQKAAHPIDALRERIFPRPNTGLFPGRLALAPAGIESPTRYELMMGHRQIDLDVLPTGSFVAEDEVAQATAGSSDR